MTATIGHEPHPPAVIVCPRCPEVARRDEEPTAPPESVGLSARDVEVLRGIADGLTNRGVARAVHLSEDTVKGIVRDLLRRLGARDRAHAVLLALRAGVIR